MSLIEEGSGGKPKEYVKLVTDPESGEEQAYASTAHLQNRSHFGRFGSAGQVYRGSLDVNCEAGHAGSHGHSGPATHFFTAEGESEVQQTPLCPKHLEKAREHAYTTGKNITVRPIRPQDVEPFKRTRGIERLEIRTGLEGILLSSGLSGEDAIVARKTSELGGKAGKTASPRDLADSRTEEEKDTALERILKNPSPRSSSSLVANPPPSGAEPLRSKTNLTYGKNLGRDSNFTPERSSRGGRKRTANKLVAGEGRELLGEGTGLVDAAFRHYVLRTEDPKDLETVLGMSEEEHNIALDTIHMAKERENLGIPQEGIVPRGFAKGTITRRERPTGEDADPAVVEVQIAQPKNRAVQIDASVKPPAPSTFSTLETTMERIAESQEGRAEAERASEEMTKKLRRIESFKTGKDGDSRKELE